MKQAYFIATQNAFDRITEMFDVIHPITVSYWNMKSEILGLKALDPDITESKFNARYNIAHVVHGVSFKHSFIDMDWDDFTENVGWIVLNNVISIYEGWLKELHDDVFNDSACELKEKEMQFPTNGVKGIIPEMTRLTAAQSTLVKNGFYNFFITKPHYSSVPLDNLLYCYRYFKEMRNCYLHNGIIATQNLINAYNDFLPVASSVLLGVKECPQYIKPVINEKAKVSLRGVIGFSEIILNIIVTCDAELLCSKYAEIDMYKRLNSHVSIKKVISSNPTKAKKQVEGYFVKHGFVKPQNIDEMKQYLLDNKMILR